MLNYLVYGLAIRSELELVGAASIAGPMSDPDLCITVGAFATPEMHRDGPLSFRLEDDHWYFRWPGEATYRLGHGEICVQQIGNRFAVGQRILGPLLGLVLRRTGRLVLHGNVVSRPSGATCLLGATGAGKTTLTSELVKAGWCFLSDDLCVLGVENGHWVAFAGPGRLKIRTGQPLKRVETIADMQATAILERIVVVEPGVPVRMAPLGGPPALLGLITHAHMPRSLDVSGLAADHVRRAGDLASANQVLALRRGQDLGDLPTAIDLLQRGWT